jgi:hypothetical protein
VNFVFVVNLVRNLPFQEVTAREKLVLTTFSKNAKAAKKTARHDFPVGSFASRSKLAETAGPNFCKANRYDTFQAYLLKPISEFCSAKTDKTISRPGTEESKPA